MAFLVDTNVVVYRFDHRFPEKQQRATRLLAEGIRSGQARLAHQAIVEFVAAVTRPAGFPPKPILSRHDALLEAEALMAQFPVLYPTDAILRLAIRGAATYRLSWFDAHMWAYAEHHGLGVLYSEDFQHDALHGTVRVLNPFLEK